MNDATLTEALEELDREYQEELMACAEIDAYVDFARYRDTEGKRRASQGITTDITTEDWLATRRRELHSRMRNRRRKERQSRRGRRGRRSPFSLF